MESWSADLKTLMSWVAWIGFMIAAIGVMTAITGLSSSRSHQVREHLDKIMWAVVGSIVIGSAAAVVTFVLKTV